VSAAVYKETLARAVEALDAAVAPGTLAVLDERAFGRFAQDVCAAVARRAAASLDTSELLTLIAEQDLLKPGAAPLSPGISHPDIDVSEKTRPGTNARALSFRGQLQFRIADALGAAVLARLNSAYREARA